MGQIVEQTNFVTMPLSQQARKSPPTKTSAPTKGCFRNPGEKCEQRKVWFDYITIKEFPMILGDNPSVKDGVPITIGWKPQRRLFCELEEYELHHRRRRYGDELLIPAITRIDLAILGGASVSQVGTTIMEVARIQGQRAQSSQTGPLELLRDGIDRRLHPNRKVSAFSRVPNEAPRILSHWKANSANILANAAA